MTLDPGILTGALGCLLSIASVVLVRRYGAGSAIAATRMREEWGAQRIGHTTEIESLKRQIENLETSLKNSDEILREGRLNHSSRAHALQLLRSGVSPDNAATSLDMPRREMRLLAKVSRLLCVYR
jgi:hypothetical protein